MRSKLTNLTPINEKKRHALFEMAERNRLVVLVYQTKGDGCVISIRDNMLKQIEQSAKASAIPAVLLGCQITDRWGDPVHGYTEWRTKHISQQVSDLETTLQELDYLIALVKSTTTIWYATEEDILED